MIVNTNVAPLNMNDALSNNTNNLNNSIEKISSSQKITRDENSNISIADKLRNEVSSLNQSVDNGISAVAMLQIADKAIAQQSNILEAIKSKLIQVRTENKEGRTDIVRDINRLLFQLDNIAARTNYNGTSLLQKSKDDNSPVDELKFHMSEIEDGAITIDTNNIQSNSQGLRLVTLKEYRDGDDLTQDDAFEQIKIVDDALEKLQRYHFEYGLGQLQIESNTKEIMHAKHKDDVDYTHESAELVHDNLVATGEYALTQANTVPSHVQDLLRT